MTRIEPLPARRRGLFARIARWFSRLRLGVEPLPLDAYEQSTPVLAAVAAYELVSERATRLSPTLRALVDLYTASLVGCPFCLDVGSSLARAQGVTEQQLRELPRHRESEAFDDLERLALAYTEAVTRTPVNVPDELFSALRARLGDAAMVELTAVIAWENYRARMNHALGFPAQGFSDGAVCALPAPAQT